MLIPSLPEEEIETSWRRYRGAWNLRFSDRIPFRLTYSGPQIVMEKVLDDPRPLLKTQLLWIEERYKSKVDDDFIPYLIPYPSEGVLVTGFGCTPFFRKGALPTFRPAISEPGEVYGLKEPELLRDGWFPKVLKFIRYFQEKIGTDIRIALFDPQSPLGIASLVMGYQNFLKALYTHPEELHLLLRIVTDTLIEALRIQIEATENLFASHGNRPLDPRDGICIADDLTAILSPRHYSEFGLPYNSEIAREFGGIVVHSCGDISHNLSNLLRVPGLKGVDIGASETDVASAVGTLRDKAAVHVHPGLNWERHYLSTKEYFVRTIQGSSRYVGLMLDSACTRGDIPVISKEILRIVSRHGEPS